MPINLVVAVTDNDWFNTLRNLPEPPTEVNFWSPSASNFRALRPGELFLFKLKARYGHYIVGGGIYAYSNVMPASLAWEAFRESNGAHSYEEMRRGITQLKAGTVADHSSDFDIGCRILTQPFFFDKDDWIDSPDELRNLQRFKTYSTADPLGYQLWEQVQDRLGRQTPRGGSLLVVEESARYGEPQVVEPRLGQGAFRVIVTDAYDRRCAVTRERTLPALEAAHIIPYGDGGEHRTSNGILLRRDIHKLFDDGYVTVTPDHHFLVSKRIREEFDNGREYYDYDGSRILVPKQPQHRPDPDALMWHNENVFKG